MQRTHRSRLGIVVVFAMVATMVAATSGIAMASAGAQARASANRLKDSDGDGMPNRWERAHHTSPHRRDAKADPDKDALKNLGEYRQRTLPYKPDTDRDGLYDGAEVKQFHSDPKDADSDDDGVEDGSEDTDDDGVVDEGEDGDHQGFVGTIISFDADTGRLLFESVLGWPVTAEITDETRILVSEDCQGDEGGDESGDAPVVRCDAALLQEGQDIVEIGFASGSDHGVPVVRWIVLACPWQSGI